MYPKKLRTKIVERIEENTLRSLQNENSTLIDFSSNDYLGFAKSSEIFTKTHQFLIDRNIQKNGSEGSRLLSGNHELYQETEHFLAEIHHSESALIFNSGYTANLGFFSSIPQRGDVILYDEFIHASIRDGIKLSNAKSYKFRHNNLSDLEKLIEKFTLENTEVYVVTESVFSMDGDSPDLKKLVELTKKYKAFLVVDEAHALGVFNLGLIQKMNLENDVFARIITFGKALGCHGAVVLGSSQLKQYLVNFCRPFIYTTGLPPHAVATIKISYHELISDFGTTKSEKLQQNINLFLNEIADIHFNFIESKSAIQCCVIGGNEHAKIIADKLKSNGFDVKPILSPTVPKGQERLRFCLHEYNSSEEIKKVLRSLRTFV